MSFHPDTEIAAHGQLDFRKRINGERSSIPQLLDSEEAAALMRVHPKTLQKLARRGELKGLHVGKLWRFREVDIAAWIERQVAS